MNPANDSEFTATVMSPWFTADFGVLRYRSALQGDVAQREAAKLAMDEKWWRERSPRAESQFYFGPVAVGGA
ncbi:MAG: hypothetical protein ABIZ81_00590 [Opitutaceae bacterium]